MWAEGVGGGNVAPSAGLVRSHGLAFLRYGSGLIPVGALAGLGGCDGCWLGFGAFGRSGARWRVLGVLWLPVCLVSPWRGVAWRPAAVVDWVTELGGGTAGWGVRRVVLCGALGSWGAVGAAGVGVPTLVGWRGGVCVQGCALGDVQQADAVSLCLLECLPQAPEDIRVVLGCGEVAGVDSLGVERIGQHGFPCGLRDPPPRRLEAAVLHRPLAGPLDQALEGGLCPGLLSQLAELRVGPAPPPLSLGGAAVLGGKVGVGGCDRVVGTGGGGGPSRFLVVLCRGGARGVGARADVDSRLCAHGLRLRVGFGLAAAAVARHVLYVG